MASLSIALTVKGHGPLMLIPGEHAMLRRIVVQQIFLAAAIFTTFPVAALLEEREHLQHSLAEGERRYRALSNADDLTGLSNRRAFNLEIEEQWQQSLAAAEPLAILLLDVDLFKSYNDCHGHLAGDDCLRSIAEVITTAIRGTNASGARFGGEEFAVILPAACAKEAFAIAEAIRAGVLARALPHAASVCGLQTVSLGVASLVPEPGQPVTALLSAADQALYRAKDLGRNLVVAAPSGAGVTEVARFR